MNTDELSKDLKSVDTLVKDGIVSKERGEILKEKMIAKFEGVELSGPAAKDMPGDLAHFPGRLVAGIFKAMGNINPDRCAGMAPEQVAARKGENFKKKERHPHFVYKNCAFCGDRTYLPFYCEYCNQYFCDKHRMPFDHDCKNIDQWKKRPIV